VTEKFVWPRTLTGLSAAALLLLPLAGIEAQGDSLARSWNQPVTPFRVIGNVYYVGASDVTAFVITTPRGLILLDGGFVETVPQILANIRTLGFDPRDVKILLNSHAHYDHAGGLAELKRVTGAALYAGAGDSAVLARGGRDDFFLGDRFPFPPVTVDHPVHDGDTVALGGVTLHAVATPGHTAGCTTWQLIVHEDGKSYGVLFICSLTVLDYRMPDDPAYREILRDEQRSIDKLRRLPCDVPLAAHGSMFSLTEKIARMASGHEPLAFVDPGGCKALLDRAEAVAR